MAIAVPLRVAIALGLALLMHRRMRGVGAERASVFFPTVIPDVAYALLWLWILNPLYGPLNLAARRARAAHAVVAVGARVGAMGRDHHGPVPDRGRLPDRARRPPGRARRAVRHGRRRTARVRARRFARVTLPLMTPALLLMATRDTIVSFQATFVPALIVTEGGPPPYGTTYLPLFIYRNAFEYLRYGYASAATVCMFALTASIVWLQYRAVDRCAAAGSGRAQASAR